MSELQKKLEANLALVRAAIDDACRRAGRSDPVQLVAVTKYVDAATIHGLLTAGQVDLGESRVQQLSQRATELKGAQPAPRWHLIGHLQRNKVRPFLEHARTLHSLDSTRLADEVSRQAGSAGVVVDCFVEINIAEEEAKSGVAVSEAEALVAHAAGLSGLRLVGLMTMAPLVADPESARPVFAALREMSADFLRRGVAPPTCRGLSMGMSHDFAVAVEEGATCVRVGSALFEGLSSP